MSDLNCNECRGPLRWGTSVRTGAEISFCPKCHPELVEDPRRYIEERELDKYHPNPELLPPQREDSSESEGGSA